MKRFAGFSVALIIVLAAILIIRANTVYSDQQYRVDKPITPVDLDGEAIVRRFSQAIRIRTISYDEPEQVETQPFAELHSHIEASYPLVHQHATRTLINDYSVIYSFPGSDKSLQPVLFMGHLDVVPVDESSISKWQRPPFSGDVVDGAIWGRGTIDDKATIFALLEAMEKILKKEIHRERGIYIAFGHDEEIGGHLGAKAIAEHFAERSIRFEFVLDEGGAVTDGLIPGTSQPVALVGVAEKGFVNLRLTVNAEGGHSSQPPRNTAAGVLAQAIVKVEDNPFPPQMKFFNLMFDAVGFSTPLSRRLPMANQWLLSPLLKQALMASPSTAASAHTTTAVTMLQGSSKSNILPSQATAVVNFRILPGDTIAGIKAHIERVIDDPRVEIDAFMENEASPVSSTQSYGFKLIEQTIRRLDSNVLVTPYLVQGGTDARYFYALSDNVYRFLMVRMTPASIRRVHGIDEQISVENYLEAVQFSYAMLKQTAEGAVIN